MSDDLRELIELRDLVLRAINEGSQFSDYKKLEVTYREIAYRTPAFNWNNWKKGLQGLKNAGAQVFVSDEVYDSSVKSHSFEEFNREELNQLLLMIHRVNRFSDEYFDDQLENGVILKILDRVCETFDGAN